MRYVYIWHEEGDCELDGPDVFFGTYGDLQIHLEKEARIIFKRETHYDTIKVMVAAFDSNEHMIFEYTEIAKEFDVEITGY